MSCGWVHNHSVLMRINGQAAGGTQRIGQGGQLRGIQRTCAGSTPERHVQAAELKFYADVGLGYRHGISTV